MPVNALIGIQVVGTLVFALAVIVQAQTGSGSVDFISIDCGCTASYTDTKTGIYYVNDAGYIDSGSSKGIAAEYTSINLEKQFNNIRSFPDGARNCYTLKPHQVSGTQYLIRARFMYGNYDSLNQVPEFDLYIGGNFWSTVKFANANDSITVEIIHSPRSAVTYVCLVNKGKGTPFISVLELRLLSSHIYNSTSGSMTLSQRLDLGSNKVYRYSDDIYDRIWMTVDQSDAMRYHSTPQHVDPDIFAQPSSVMVTAVTPFNPDVPLRFSWKSDFKTQYYIFLHFAEIQLMPPGTGILPSRIFDIYINGVMFFESFTPTDLGAVCIYNPIPLAPATSYNLTLRRTTFSARPPILNAIEIYSLTDMSQMETDLDDVKAVINIKSAYNLNRKWQGDPCSPRDYTWQGLQCSFTIHEAPRILALNLSSSNLAGQISTYIYDLKLLQKLDLSNNNLEGPVPDFLSKMTSLKYINLNGNNLNGIVPAELVAKSNQGSLTLSVEGNPNLCLSSPCSVKGPPPAGVKMSIIIASAAGVIILLLVIVVAVLCNTKRKKQQAEVTKPVMDSITAPNERIQTQNHSFTFSEVSQMTNNFSKVIGKGGFGTVYLGVKNDVKVAVKILSPLSAQGYKAFKAEALLLMRVHHRNLTSLIGFCDEGDKYCLIYDFMANGNLESHISTKYPQYLSWEARLRVALDVAQGLEYLHIGCTPPIVHRDIKPSNILLSDKFEAKLADFGLSRAFNVDNGQTSSVSTTVVAGTPGYLDPEYYYTQQLNEKSDVFSFGIVLLEIISSQPVISGAEEKVHISRWVDQVLSTQGDITVIVDSRLEGEYATNSAWKAVEVAMSCVSQNAHRRPTMTQVISELSQCLSMEKAHKNKGCQTSSMESIEIASFDLNSEFVPSAR